MDTKGTCSSVPIILVSVLSRLFLEKIIFSLKITRLYQISVFSVSGQRKLSVLYTGVCSVSEAGFHCISIVTMYTLVISIDSCRFIIFDLITRPQMFSLYIAYSYIMYVLQLNLISG